MLLDGRNIKGVGHNCPECGEIMTRRTSEMAHALLQKIYWRCRNIECSATFAGVTEVTHCLTPSQTRNQSVRLPYSNQSEFALSIKRRVEQLEKSQAAALKNPLDDHSKKMRREIIGRMLESGKGSAEIMERMVCTADLIISVMNELEEAKNIGGASE